MSRHDCHLHTEGVVYLGDKMYVLLVKFYIILSHDTLLLYIILYHILYI